MPEIAYQPVDIVNRALARIGQPPLLTLDDETDFAQAAQMIYDTEVEAALGKLRWRFARQTVQLSRLSGAPASGYAHAYQIPGGMLGLPEKLSWNPRRAEATIRDFEIEADQVHCDHDAVFARGTFAVDPSAWPPEFRKAIIVGIASALAVPVTHDLTLATALRQEAYGEAREGGVGGLLGRAIAQEVASSPPQEGSVDSDPLTGARWGGYEHGTGWSGAW
jgi:hypothetical protein